MIVMKFGGASLASPTSIRRVASIVQSQLQRNPIVVVSALGDTTDHLLAILEHASRAESYIAWRLQEEVKTYHFCVAEDLLGPRTMAPIDQFIRQIFRDLHVRMLEVCEGERGLTAELRDWVTSLGEQLSSSIVTAVLEEHAIQAKRLDAAKLIVTDERFTNAAPRQWETYARIRWSVPITSRTHVVVLAGFIGATEDGRITTLGRGGSDLTASLVGAAVNAEEIQVWKDVDGMLTWDPELRSGGHRVRSLSYEEANELAQAGAVILHPESVAPAQRLRIPVVIRNVSRPHGGGTRIGMTQTGCTNAVKSIACKSNVTMVEIRSPKGERIPAEYSLEIERVCRERKAATLLAVSDDTIYLSFECNEPDPGRDLSFDHCTQVHVRTNQAIVTLVGEHLKRCNVLARLSTFLAQRSALVLPQNAGSCSVRMVIAQEELAALTDALQRIFFSEMDPAFFAPVECVPERQVKASPKTRLDRERQAFAIHRSRFA